jgi:predicted  nucleic acid-binding Zn-ribbon protein
MGPTNIALVQLFQADQQLREAQSRLDAVTRNVRIQQRRVDDLAEKLKLGQSRLKEQQAKSANLELDLKTRDAHIEKLRTQQQNAKNNKEYQTFLIEINTLKVDRNKVEEETMAALESVERGQGEIKELTSSHEAEQAKLTSMRNEINDKITTLQAEIDSLQPARAAAASAAPARARDAFDRLADRFEGEALAALAKPDRRREEYICTSCNMSLVVDIYNRLHSRDDLVFCPSCQRILFIPDDLPVETAVHKKKAPREPRIADANIPAAPRRLQESAENVVNSVMPDASESTSESTSESAPATSEPSTQQQG